MLQESTHIFHFWSCGFLTYREKNGSDIHTLIYLVFFVPHQCTIILPTWATALAAGAGMKWSIPSHAHSLLILLALLSPAGVLVDRCFHHSFHINRTLAWQLQIQILGGRLQFYIVSRPLIYIHKQDKYRLVSTHNFANSSLINAWMNSEIVCTKFIGSDGTCCRQLYQSGTDITFMPF